ncbi:hypothetical protein [Helicobacter sp. T3_23-1056]
MKNLNMTKPTPLVPLRKKGGISVVIERVCAIFSQTRIFVIASGFDKIRVAIHNQKNKKKALF